MLSGATARDARLAELPAFLIGDVDVVAAEGYRACLAGEAIVVPGVLNRAATMAAGTAPKWLLRRIVGALGRRLI